MLNRESKSAKSHINQGLEWLSRRVRHLGAPLFAGGARIPLLYSQTQSQPVHSFLQKPNFFL